MPGFHTLTLKSLPELPVRVGVLYLLDGKPRRLGGLVLSNGQKPCWRWLSLDTRDQNDDKGLVLLRLCRRYGIHRLDLDEVAHPQAMLLKRLAALEGWGSDEWSRLG